MHSFPRLGLVHWLRRLFFNEIDAIFFLLKQNMTPDWLSCYFPRFLGHWRTKCVNGWQTDVTFWCIWKKIMHNLIKNNLYCCLYTCLFVWAVLCTIQDHFVADPWWWFNKPGKKIKKYCQAKIETKFSQISHGLLNIWTELLYLTCPHEADLLTLIMSHKLTQYF